MSSGDDITITSAQNVVLTRQGNFSGTLSLSGTPAQKQTLTAASSIEDPDGIAGVITFSWQRSISGSNGWSTIAAANTSSYTLTQDDVGFYIRAVASYTDNLGTPESVASAPTAAAISNINDNPVLTGTPVALPNGTEDFTYVLKASDLLQGYSDSDGDTLSITSVTTDSANGSITNNSDGTWTYLPTTDLNGEVSFSFVVSDGNGGTTNGSTSLTLDAVDDEELLDEDNNGIVDGSELSAYQLFSEAGAITLQNSSGSTYNDNSTASWDVVAAVDAGDGFQVLLDGAGSYENQFYLWTVNSDGVITNGSGWNSADGATSLGWEDTFNFDTNGDGLIGAPLTDDDGNGIVDGSELSAYQLFSEAGAITLQNSSGSTYNDNSTASWDVVAAVDAGDGFQVLLDGAGSYENQFYLWTVNSDGVITNGSGWNSADGATSLGWEDTFNFDTNGDGLIGAPLTDDDGNGIVDGSELSAYQLFSEAGAITLQNSSGSTYNDNSTASWDVVAAVDAGDGFQVLLDGAGSYENQFYLWTVNSDGVITNGSGWNSADGATSLGWEDTFNFDTNGDGLIGAPLTDDDGNGIVDGSELSAYQLFSEAGAITLQNSSGSTYNDNSTASWDVVAAVDAGDGFQVLLDGAGSYENQFYLWTVNSDGVITNGSGWNSADGATSLGWEDTFNFDTNGDGLIGAPLTDDDGNGIVDGSELSAYQLFSEAGAITLQNSSGSTYNDNSTASWDVVAAVDAGDGFQVLLDGAGSYENQFYLWTVNSDGVITNGSGWNSADGATSLGWEDTFNFDTNGDGLIGAPLTDDDGNGIVDGSELSAYQLFSEAGAITLQNSSGSTYNDNSTASWDVVAAVDAGDGFQVLLDGAGSYENQFYLWTVNSDGVITNGSGWNSADGATSLGWEDTFNFDTNGDGLIGAPLTDDDGNGIVDGSELSAYQLFSEAGAITLQNRGDELADQGFETLFAVDLNADGFI